MGLSWMAIKSNFPFMWASYISDFKWSKAGQTRNSVKKCLQSMEVLQAHFIGPTSCELRHGTDEQSVFYVAGLLAW